MFHEMCNCNNCNCNLQVRHKLVNTPVRHKSVNTPLSHERHVVRTWLAVYSGHVMHFVQLYPQPLYTVSQVRTTSRLWDTGVLTDLCLTLYFAFH